MNENGLALDALGLKEERLVRRPLIGAMARLQGYMAGFKGRVRAFYFEVILSRFRCSDYGGLAFSFSSYDTSRSQGLLKTRRTHSYPILMAHTF